MNHDVLVILCTCPDRETAIAIGRVVVEEGLAACVSVVPGLLSIYRWEGRVESEQEQLLLIKTPAERYGELEKRLADMHPYEVPEILALPVAQGSIEYLEWLQKACGGH